jgi:biopolymer transport protein ExbD
MRIPGSVKASVALVVLGAGIHFSVERWMSTRIVHPVDMPISLAKGHIRTGPFRLNLEATYVIYIHPGTDQNWDQAHPDCSPWRHVQTRFVLYRNGKVFSSLEEPTVLPWSSWFEAGPGVYDLDLEVMSDFRCLDPAHPRLEIAAMADSYDSAAFAAKLVSVIGVYIGFAVLIFGPIVRRVQPLDRSPTITDSTLSIVQNFQWAQKLPLRRPISGFPSFGLYAGIFFALMAMVMMLIVGGLRYTPRGVWVHLLKPGVTPKKSDHKKSDQWTDPLVVRVVFGGFGQQPKLRVNSRQVTWDDFDHELREELGRRREWVVYVEGDYCVAWANVASVIDIARRDGAKVFLLTEDDEKECPSLPKGRAMRM